MIKNYFRTRNTKMIGLKMSGWYFFLLTIILVVFSVDSKGQDNYRNLLKKTPAFIENKGQVTDQYGSPQPDVKYIYNTPGFKIIFKENGFSYEAYHIEQAEKRVEEKFTNFGEPDTSAITFKTHRVDMTFIGANADVNLTADNPLPQLTNYYLAHTPEEGITGVSSFRKITYQNLYPNIDVVFSIGEDLKVKYDIIVHPGGKLADLMMRYEGMNAIKLDRNKIIVETDFGSIEEEIPHSYIKETGKSVQVNYSLNGNIITFGFEIDINGTLVIDPVIAWGGTYFGGNSTDISNAIAVTDSGFTYITGRTGSSSGIATQGSFKDTFSAYYDVFISNFNIDGSLQWSTYYGGTSYDEGNSLVVNSSNEIIVAGRTQSSTGISTSGAHKSTITGNNDLFVVKFTHAGSRIWGSYFGGNYEEINTSIATDGNDYIYITGFTNSTNGIATNGVHQTSYAGSDDGFVAKFNTSGSFIWGTYLGGTQNDYIYDISLDDSNYIYIAGNTLSTSGIASANSHQSSNAGYSDAFIVKLDTTGSRLWGTYLGGTNYGIWQRFNCIQR